jgi:uncharacterized membrane protein YeaQ/YmgE (transglycosylase-associated protein family)
VFVLFFWIIFGALVGWIVGILKDVHGIRGMITYALFGIVGGVLGGAGSTWLFGSGNTVYGNDLTSMMFAIVGSVVIVILLATADGKHS